MLSPRRLFNRIGFAVACAVTFTANAYAATPDDASVRAAVDHVVQPLMQAQHIPGMSVGVSIDGRHYVYDYGVASRDTQAPVNAQTLFEIGSLSKVFAATLATCAVEQKRMTLNDPVSRYWTSLKGTAFDRISIMNVGTHTSGLPLFVPDDITTDAQLTAMLRSWQPEAAPGSHRLYSNIGIGLLGTSAAAALHERYENAVVEHVFAPLGMKNSFFDVPASRARDYAQGYTAQDKPIRMHPGLLAGPAYGVRSNARDLLRFVDANIETLHAPSPLNNAIIATHTGYFHTGGFTQDLVWEQYPQTIALPPLLDGNGVVMKNLTAEAIDPPTPPASDVLINKTGSTNGFAAYVVFVPARHIGIVMLANRSYPIPARVEAADTLLKTLR